MNIHLFSFIRNEAYLLRRWIPYHTSIVGLENIHIIDHHSYEQACVNLLNTYKKMGLNVVETQKSFKLKYKLLTQQMHKYHSEADILIPLDADEFLCVRNEDGTINVDSNVIREQLDSLPLNGKKYAFHVYESVPDQIDYNDPLVDMKYFTFFEASETSSGPNQQTKTFFPAKNFSYTDQGNHIGGVLLAPNDIYNISKMAIAHYHVMGYRHFLEKLRKAVEAYNLSELPPDYKGIGMRWNRWYHETKGLNEEEKKEWFKKKFMEKGDTAEQMALSDRFRIISS